MPKLETQFRIVIPNMMEHEKNNVWNRHQSVSTRVFLWKKIPTKKIREWLASPVVSPNLIRHYSVLSTNIDAVVPSICRSFSAGVGAKQHWSLRCQPSGPETWYVCIHRAHREGSGIQICIYDEPLPTKIQCLLPASTSFLHSRSIN